MKIHIKERKQDFARFRAEWTPTTIVAEPDGTERHRIEGFLPADDFLAQLHMGLAKAAFSRGEFDDARLRFEGIVNRYSKTDAAPEALYWSAVSAYKATNGVEHLKQGGQKLKEKYPQTEWAKKSSVWLG